MKKFLRNNGLALVMTALFIGAIIGQSITGMREYNEDQRSHDQLTVSYTSYLQTSHFGEAVFENWESEFLQMGLFVLLTVMLFQKGSPESKDPDTNEKVDEDPRSHRNDPNAPWPVRHGGVVLKVYEHSLVIALMSLFIISFCLHAVTGARQFTAEQHAHGESGVSAAQFLFTPTFWEQSLQNWQSEFMSVGALVLLSVFLRQKGSAESKPVFAPHAETGG